MHTGLKKKEKEKKKKKKMGRPLRPPAVGAGDIRRKWDPVGCDGTDIAAGLCYRCGQRADAGAYGVRTLWRGLLGR